MFSLVFSPVDLGIPSERPRKYTQFHVRGISPLVHSDLAPSEAQERYAQLFKQLFFRRCVCDASVYVVADPYMIAQHRRALAAKTGDAWAMEWDHCR